MGKKFIIEHDRPKCIGCGVCVSLAPNFWEMNNDGKAVLKGNKKNMKEISEKDVAKNKAAAESCPVNIIHITDPEGKKVI